MPTTDDLLLRIAYLEENKEALSRAADTLDQMTESERALSQENKNLADSSEQVSGGFSKMQAGIVTLQAGIGVAEMVIGKFKEAWNFAKEGAEIRRIQEQFDNMAASINTDANKLLAGLDKAAHGTVDDEALMQTATRAMALGIASNSQDLIGLMEIARASSVAFGGDTSAAFERISYAVENLAPRALKQSGIIIDLTKAYEDYSKKLGKTADQLTDEEKRQALLNQTLEKGAELVKRIGDQGEDAATKMARFETKVADLGDQIKSAAVDAIEPWLDRFDMIETAFDANASEVDKARATYAMFLSQGLNPNSEAMLLLKQRIDELNKSLGDTNLFASSTKGVMDALTTSIKAAQAAIEGNKATDISKLTPEKQQEATSAYQSFQTKLSDIEVKGDSERIKAANDAQKALAELEASNGQRRADIISRFASDEAGRLTDFTDKRVDILTNYADTERQITLQQNQDRLKLAQSYGYEVQRMEEAHQLDLQRMQQDHGRNIRKLAESRDALAIEDEQETYEINRSRAEEDYQIQARQKSEDYARQLADQNAAAAQQRAAAKAAEEKQLADLKENFIKQDAKYHESYVKQLGDLDKATADQRTKIQDAEAQKLNDIATNQANERAQATTQWTQWRNEHEIFFAGERALYDNFLKYTRDQLTAYVKGGTVSTSPTVAPGPPNSVRAGGGNVDPFGVYLVGERGPETLYMGRQGGYVSPGAGGNTFNVSVNVANSNASAADIKSAVYQSLVEVIDKAMRQ